MGKHYRNPESKDRAVRKRKKKKEHVFKVLMSRRRNGKAPDSEAGLSDYDEAGH